MITTEKKIFAKCFAGKLQDTYPDVVYFWQGEISGAGEKAIFLPDEEVPSNWSETYAAVTRLENIVATNEDIQTIVDTYDEEASEEEEENNQANIVQRIGKDQLALWLSVLDLLREQAGVTESNENFKQRVITKRKSLGG